jgi:ankyrin repeat protein
MQRKVAAGSIKATNPPPPPPSLCGHCKQTAQPGKSLLVCSSCHEACYCSTEHQVADWISHKVLCKQRKKELKKENEKEKERKQSDAAINYLLLNHPPIAVRLAAAELFASLCIACSEGEAGRARQILLSGVDVNRQTDGGFTPTYIACQNGHTECLSLLINHGAQLDKARDTGATPAFIACQNRHTECLSLLINHGAQLDKANNTGETPAYTACQTGHTECLSLLVDHGVDCSKITDDGLGPIHIACQNGYFECVKALLDRGKVDVNCTTINRQTPALICCHDGHVKILHLLIQHGADLSLADKMFGMSPAHVASVFGRVKMLALIKKVNADLINQRDNQGRTPLFCARESSQNGAAEWLIEHGAEEAGELLKGAGLELIKVQLIQMPSIISAHHLSHILFSLYCRVQSMTGKKRLDWRDWRLSIARTRTVRQIERSKALD